MSTRFLLTQSLFAVITGAGNTGKTWQIHSMLKASVDGEPVATPCIYVMAEASAEGTAGEVLNDPSRCVVWPAADCDDAYRAVLECFPDSGPVTLGQAKALAYKAVVDKCKELKTVPPPPPAADKMDSATLRSLVIDTASTLYKGSINTAKAIAMREAGVKPGDKPKVGIKGAAWNDNRRMGGYAASRMGQLIDLINGVTTRLRGLIALVSCHTRPAYRVSEAKEGEEAFKYAIGEAPDLGSTATAAAGIRVDPFSATWLALHAKANVVWHCFRIVPDFSNVRPENINTSSAAEKGITHGVITMSSTYPGLGPVMWVKRQGGDGPLGVFGQLPPYWHPDSPMDDQIAAISQGPDLGKILVAAVMATRSEGVAASLT